MAKNSEAPYTDEGLEERSASPEAAAQDDSANTAATSDMNQPETVLSQTASSSKGETAGDAGVDDGEG